MARSTIADLTVDELRTLIREVVVQTLSEMFGDPDEGLGLSDDFQLELQQSLAGLKTPGRTIPVREVAERLGLTW